MFLVDMFSRLRKFPSIFFFLSFFLYSWIGVLDCFEWFFSTCWNDEFFSCNLLIGWIVSLHVKSDLYSWNRHRLVMMHVLIRVLQRNRTPRIYIHIYIDRYIEEEIYYRNWLVWLGKPRRLLCACPH